MTFGLSFAWLLLLGFIISVTGNRVRIRRAWTSRSKQVVVSTRQDPNKFHVGVEPEFGETALGLQLDESAIDQCNAGSIEATVIVHSMCICIWTM